MYTILKRLIQDEQHKLWQLVRYCVVGAMGVGIQTLTLYVWVTVLGLRGSYLWGVVVGFCIALLVSFILQKYWTFKDFEHKKTRHQLPLYAVVALINLGLNALLLHGARLLFEGVGKDFFDTWYIVVQFVLLFALAILSFVLNRTWSFRPSDVV